MKKALITGINGQDGSYLAELLLEKGYEVWGTVKRNSVSETQSSRIENLRDSNSVNLEYADLSDMASLVRVLSKVQPDEVYNLAAQSHVRISFDQPIYTANVTGVGRMRFGLDLDGILIYFTEHNCANNEPNVYMSSPNQPIRYEIRQVGVGSGSFDMICSQVSTEGALNGLYSTVADLLAYFLLNMFPV